MRGGGEHSVHSTQHVQPTRSVVLPLHSLQRAHHARPLQQVMDGSVNQRSAAHQLPGRNQEQSESCTASAPVNAG